MFTDEVILEKLQDFCERLKTGPLDEEDGKREDLFPTGSESVMAEPSLEEEYARFTSDKWRLSTVNSDYQVWGYLFVVVTAGNGRFARRIRKYSSRLRA